MDFDNLFSTVQTIAVCYPIYGSCVPRIMKEFVEKYLKAFEIKKLIIFCTQMMFSGDGAKAFARLIPNCDKRVIYAEHFNMPNNISALSYSKRFLISQNDQSELALHMGEWEYCIEFLLNENGSITALENSYRAAGMPANGVAVTDRLFNMINAFSYGLTAIVMIAIG